MLSLHRVGEIELLSSGMFNLVNRSGDYRDIWVRLILWLTTRMLRYWQQVQCTLVPIYMNHYRKFCVTTASYDQKVRLWDLK